jgi:hypothetical protein
MLEKLPFPLLCGGTRTIAYRRVLAIPGTLNRGSLLAGGFYIAPKRDLWTARRFWVWVFAHQQSAARFSNSIV